MASPGSSQDYAVRNLEIEFSFSPPTEQQASLVEYKLYQGDMEVCTAGVGEVTSLKTGSKILGCTITAADGSYQFKLAAVSNDGSHSFSPPFTYVIGEKAPPQGQGSKTITYGWTNTDSNLSSYQMYMNEQRLCETSDLQKGSLSCKADLLNGMMEFFIVSLNQADAVIAKSNILTLNPEDFPEILAVKRLVFTLGYTDPVTSAGGFKVYNNDALICETNDAAAREIVCETNSLAATNSFTVKAVDAQGVETMASNAIDYHRSSPTPPGSGGLPPAIKMTVFPKEGVAPLQVSFDASESTGDIKSYFWEFGDGTTANGAKVDHIYPVAASYTARLLITDSLGTRVQQETSINVSQPTVQPEPPKAILSSSNTVGEVPLEVLFDGSGSTATSQPITSYTWDFGDGSMATGSQPRHIFAAAGTYYTTLTVKDSAGQTDSVSTPVIVTGSVTANNLPTASFLASPLSGSCPLTLYADGSSSSDEDGSITSYSWNFGDGKTASGATARHSYVSPANYTVSLTVTDNQGGSASISKTIACTEAVKQQPLAIEVGEVALSSQWQTVLFENQFVSPVVIAGPPGFNDLEPVVVRLKNITNKGFEIRLQEWSYLDGEHEKELVSYLVVEQGATTLADGTRIEAGFIPATNKTASATFTQEFTLPPLVLATVSSSIDQSPVTSRVFNVGSEGFSYRIKREEGARQGHPTETLSFVAWQLAEGLAEDLQYEANVTGISIDHNWKTLNFSRAFTEPPFLIAALQSKKGGDTTALRQQNLSLTGVEVKLEEEQSKDNETTHVKEAVGFLAIAATAPQQNEKRLSFSWTYSGNEDELAGFSLFAGDQKICETDEPDARQLSCTVSLSNVIQDFTVSAIRLDGSETEKSNGITVDPANLP